MGPWSKALWVVGWLALERSALGCPFCDQGGFDAARFIMAVFLPFAAAATFVLLAVRRSHKNSPRRDPSKLIFDAERKEP